MTNLLFDRGELRTLTYAPGATRSYWSGRDWQLGTARYWESVAEATPTPDTYRLGSTLNEEIAVCLLGGHGMTWDTVFPYFERVRDSGALDSSSPPSTDEIRRLLLEPVLVGGRLRRYRFPNQRSERLSKALAHSARIDGTLLDVELRDELQRAPGIGPKTASWIVRNYRASNDVAVVDIHIVRAGVVAGVFDPSWTVTRDYSLFERAFLSWCRASELAAAKLDSAIWAALSGRGTWTRQILGARPNQSLHAVWPVDGRS